MAHTRHAIPPEPSSLQQPEAPPPITRYLLNRETVRRDIDAFELFLLVDKLVGPLELSVPADEYGSVHPDLRRHMRGVRGG